MEVSKYSKPEWQNMTAAFKRLFKVDDNIMQTDAIKNWMANAPVEIVEFDGKIKGENSKQKDRRMEIIDVYDGNVSPLVNYLKGTFRDKRNLSKWELIFTIANGITAVQKTIEQATLEATFGNNGDIVEVPQTTEELQSNPSSSTEEHVSTVPTPEVVDKEPQQTVEQELTTNVTPEETHEENHTEQSSVTPSGNVQQEEEKPLFNKPITNFKEDSKMSDLKDLVAMAAAPGVTATADPTQEQAAPAANVAKNDKVSEESKVRVTKQIADQKEQRNNWVRQNTVSAIISTMKPAALRVTSRQGRPVADGTDAAKATEAINKKISKFIVAVSGVEGITQDVFEAKSDAEKYANVVDDADHKNVKKAAATYELLKQMKQNPTGDFAAYIPAEDKVSYPTRGYFIGSTPYPTQDFIVALCENSTGAIYGEGSVDADGKDASENATVFVIGVAKSKEAGKAKATGIAKTTGDSPKKPVIRPRNKKAFLEDKSHVKFLFTQEATDGEGTASFKAAVNVGGELVAASVPVYALDTQGQRIANPSKAAGKTTYKKKVASVSVSVPVTKIKKEFGAEFKLAGEESNTAALRWGITWGEAVKGNFGALVELGSSPIVDVFANVYEGKLTLGDSMRNAESIKKLQAAANKQAEEDAAASASELEG